MSDTLKAELLIYWLPAVIMALAGLAVTLWLNRLKRRCQRTFHAGYTATDRDSCGLHHHLLCSMDKYYHDRITGWAHISRLLGAAIAAYGLGLMMHFLAAPYIPGTAELALWQGQLFPEASWYGMMGFVVGYNHKILVGCHPDDLLARYENWYERERQERQRQHQQSSTSDAKLRKLFGLKPGFTREDLKQARRKRAAKLHPDGMAAATKAARRKAEDKLKEINAAYDELLYYAA